MQLKYQSYCRPARFILLLVSIWLAINPCFLTAQTPECEYPGNFPTVENARLVFRSADLECAKKELRDLLSREEISRETRADAHMLLASVYFIEETDNITRRIKVKQELVEVFLSYRNWQGQLEIRSAEFRKILSDARDLAEGHYQNSPDLQKDYEEQLLLIDSTTQVMTEKRKWYTKWWAIGSGVGIIAMAAILMTGSNDQTGSLPIDTLPPFPDRP